MDSDKERLVLFTTVQHIIHRASPSLAELDYRTVDTLAM
jgi:hypothetical protein